MENRGIAYCGLRNPPRVMRVSLVTEASWPLKSWRVYGSRNSGPVKFDWGNSAEGAHHLAFAVLADASGIQTAAHLDDLFTTVVVARLPSQWAMHRGHVRLWIQKTRSWMKRSRYGMDYPLMPIVTDFPPRLLNALGKANLLKGV